MYRHQGPPAGMYVYVLFSNHCLQKLFFEKPQQTPAKQVGVMCGLVLYVVSQLTL